MTVGHVSAFVNDRQFQEAVARVQMEVGGLVEYTDNKLEIYEIIDGGDTLMTLTKNARGELEGTVNYDNLHEEEGPVHLTPLPEKGRVRVNVESCTIEVDARQFQEAVAQLSPSP